MTHVDEVERQIKALMAYAERFFHEVRDPADVYARLGLAFNQLQAEMVGLAAEGHLTPEVAQAWAWYSTVVPAMLAVVFLDAPKYGTRELELQLIESYRATLAKSRTVTIAHPDAQTGEVPAAIKPH